MSMPKQKMDWEVFRKYLAKTIWRAGWARGKFFNIHRERIFSTPGRKENYPSLPVKLPLK